MLNGLVRLGVEAGSWSNLTEAVKWLPASHVLSNWGLWWCIDCHDCVCVSVPVSAAGCHHRHCQASHQELPGGHLCPDQGKSSSLQLPVEPAVNLAINAMESFIIRIRTIYTAV